jgi:hypothetical protein
MKTIASANGTQLIVSDPDRITDEEVEAFDYIAFKENITIALTPLLMPGLLANDAQRTCVSWEGCPSLQPSYRHNSEPSNAAGFPADRLGSHGAQFINLLQLSAGETALASRRQQSSCRPTRPSSDHDSADRRRSDRIAVGHMGG